MALIQAWTKKLKKKNHIIEADNFERKIFLTRKRKRKNCQEKQKQESVGVEKLYKQACGLQKF